MTTRRQYLIDGQASGLLPRPPTDGERWRSADLYGDENEDDVNEDGELVVAGYDNACRVARQLCDEFSPCSLDPGETYLIRYDVYAMDGAFRRRFERRPTGRRTS